MWSLRHSLAAISSGQLNELTVVVGIEVEVEDVDEVTLICSDDRCGCPGEAIPVRLVVRRSQPGRIILDIIVRRQECVGRDAVQSGERDGVSDSDRVDLVDKRSG